MSSFCSVCNRISFRPLGTHERTNLGLSQTPSCLTTWDMTVFNNHCILPGPLTLYKQLLSAFHCGYNLFWQSVQIPPLCRLFSFVQWQRELSYDSGVTGPDNDHTPRSLCCPKISGPGSDLPGLPGRSEPGPEKISSPHNDVG